MADPRPVRGVNHSGVPRQSGFTLIEIMVVVVIIAIMATLVTLSIGNRALDDRMEVESQRIERILQLALEEAETKGIEIGLRFTESKMQLLAMNVENRWVEYAETGALRSREIPEPFYIDLFVEGRAVAPAQDVPLESASVDDDEEGENENAIKIEPQVLLLSSGEVTAFALDLRANGHAPYFHLDVDAVGKFVRERKGQPS